jgi:hypothetical protein
VGLPLDCPGLPVEEQLSQDKNFCFTTLLLLSTWNYKGKDYMCFKQFFWLHVKKSAGMTTRQLLQPYYVEVDRINKPKTFIQAKPEEYNDILNNFRVVLGDYQFKRCLFARDFLYPSEWDNIYSFAFSREPVDRVVSMFYYLYWTDAGFIKNLKQAVRKYVSSRKLLLNRSYAFDAFLDYVERARNSASVFRPLGVHFTTHTAPMWDDITDLEGNILLTSVFRLENLVDGINLVFESCGYDTRLDQNEKQINRNPHRKPFKPTKEQLGRIKKIYLKDFEVYENAWHR